MDDEPIAASLANAVEGLEDLCEGVAALGLEASRESNPSRDVLVLRGELGLEVGGANVHVVHDEVLLQGHVEDQARRG
eukprot:26590-Prorocentrum_minimum.AAC.1